MRTQPQNLAADWSLLGKRAPWLAVTSAELAKVLGVHLQTINNWKLRGILPEPLPRAGGLKGNKNYFQIGSIRAWLESTSEDQINRDWIASDIGAKELTLLEANYLIKTLYSRKKAWAI